MDNKEKEIMEEQQKIENLKIKNREYNKNYCDKNREKIKIKNRINQRNYRRRMLGQLNDATDTGEYLEVKIKKEVVPKTPTKYSLNNAKNQKYINTVIVPYYIKHNLPRGADENNTAKYILYFKRVDKLYNLQNPLKYYIMLKNVYRNTANEDEENYIKDYMKFLDKDNIQNFILFMKENYNNTNTLKTSLLPYVILTSYYTEFYDSYQILANLSAECGFVYENIRDENSVSIEDNKKIIDFHPTAIIDKLSTIKDLKEQLIFSLYTLHTPRRLEYGSVIYTDSNDILNLNDKNYLISMSGYYIFVFNQYKNKAVFGKQLVICCPILVSILDKYIQENKIEYNDPLFNELNFGITLTTVFSKIYNVDDLSLRWVRISYSTYLNSIKISIADKKKRCIEMGHSVSTNSQYNKMFVDD